jgi:hypothetical protein
MTPLQAAVGVVQKGIRPTIPPTCPPPLADIMRLCWQRDPAARPTFEQVGCWRGGVGRGVDGGVVGRGVEGGGGGGGPMQVATAMLDTLLCMTRSPRRLLLETPKRVSPTHPPTHPPTHARSLRLGWRSYTQRTASRTPAPCQQQRRGLPRSRTAAAAAACSPVSAAGRVWGRAQGSELTPPFPRTRTQPTHPPLEARQVGAARASEGRVLAWGGGSACVRVLTEG